MNSVIHINMDVLQSYLELSDKSLAN